jgi:putative ABC transport system permease protein
MNLGFRDVRHQWQRFVATGLGLGLLFSVVLAMGGIYRGMVEDAVLLVDAVGADLWIVQRGTQGPFAERSVVPESLEIRARAVPGVESARAFTTFTVQPTHRGRVLRLSLVGLGWPDDKGDGLSLEQGRPCGRPTRRSSSTGLWGSPSARLCTSATAATASWGSAAGWWLRAGTRSRS